MNPIQSTYKLNWIETKNENIKHIVQHNNKWTKTTKPHKKGEEEKCEKKNVIVVVVDDFG